MKKYIALLMLLLSIFTFNIFISCKKDCNHAYYINERVEATCTKEGYEEYKCSECKDKYKESIPAKGHTPGEAPTLEASQVCVDCKTVLAKAVDYMPYRDSDLAINYYYKYNKSETVTKVVSQNLDRYVAEPIKYVDDNGAPYNLNLSIPIQDFFTHNVSSISPLITSDNKLYTTKSGFKVAYSFFFANKELKSIHAWGQGLSDEFKNSDEELLKIVGEYQANPLYYNKIYELVDFSNCYIEISKKTASGYETVKKIDSKEDWKVILQTGKLEVSNDNDTFFYSPGTYCILFKYNMTWVTDPPSAVFKEEDTEREYPIYPYGRLNDQYEYFYVTITEDKSNILLPGNVELDENGFFCQLRALTLDQTVPFIADHSTLSFGDSIDFKVGAKVDMTKDSFYYNKQLIKSFVFTIHTYNNETNVYDKYSEYDLMPYISREIVYGDEIDVVIEKTIDLRDKKCKIVLSYSYESDSTKQIVTEQQNYYYTLSW